ncbi:HEPN-associated N-terminal domain-containing protein [Pelomonas sp. Root1444]|uniref:HEPN-associated N-terminal domain-containing protein n=1 Tax=Pelomonas sp. Root1444 TaxID=1736464 RepID=UPI00070306DA|nr:HEPN-associated N-terminal domain-containing protein [Pelomonas sp. Root1444]KQY80845.1 hypothetical protein ASD35_03065 [Pelomonas sp. Root1444]
MADNVCSECIGDDDLQRWIRQQDGPRGCDFCERSDAPTADFRAFADHVESHLHRWWSLAVDELPYESREGGYQGSELWDTHDVLDETQLEFPRDRKDVLRRALVSALPDQTWCEYDWTTLDFDRALGSSWDEFCDTIKHRRRFFFQETGRDDRDSYTPASLLATIARISSRLGLIRNIAAGTTLCRARTDLKSDADANAAAFGPPPVKYATQSNRMNPPGIPMLYLASSATTALMETRVEAAHVGTWRALRPLRVLDLRTLPPIPGFFAEDDREDRLATKFLREFAADIMVPVERDDRVHIDYLPSQVVTEFMRDHDFKGGRIDGIAYGSTVHKAGWNVALFASARQLGLDEPGWGRPVEPWLEFVGADVAKQFP